MYYYTYDTFDVSNFFEGTLFYIYDIVQQISGNVAPPDFSKLKFFHLRTYVISQCSRTHRYIYVQSVVVIKKP